MNPHQLPLPFNASLPARPNFAAAPGPSRNQPPTYTDPSYQQSFSGYGNASGGYQGYAAAYQPNLNLSGGYQPNLNLSGGYQPFPFAYPGHPPQHTTPEGYSYSSAYLQQAHAAPEPSAKRLKTHAGMGNASGPGNKAWRNCSVSGCRFTGSGDQVEIHEGDRHLIFPRGRPVERSEEEEKFANHKG
ncbi:hypothetical protein P7C73_g5421, partial [Tremellales sp. Uapishka_1]